LSSLTVSTKISACLAAESPSLPNVVRFKAPHTVSSVAGKLGPLQAVNYRARRVPLEKRT
jgi:hypothetical protein